MAANVAHSLQQKVLYIDSNGGLTASRILQLLQARTSDEEEQVKGRGVGILCGSDTVRPSFIPECLLIDMLIFPTKDEM